MNDYQILQKGFFETTKHFENRLNAICGKGWKAISIGGTNHNIYVLLEKTEKYR